MHNHRQYWFKPARFWGIFAAYYPVKWEGWAITLATLAALAVVFSIPDANSHSLSDTLIAAAPTGIIILLLFDLISFRTGEYPHWWRKWGK